jgi:hypothetical protein
MPTSTMTNLSDVFLGSEQSKYAGVALFITILIICISILLTSSKIAIEQRLLFIIFILIITIPSILMTLFELTCIVTGGNYNTRWWCWLLAWVLAIIIIFYCIMIIISLFISMTTYDMANERISDDLVNNKIDKTTENINANNYAKNIMATYEEDVISQQNPSQQNPSQQNPIQEHPPQQQQYQPPMPPHEKQPFPQQSQHINANEFSSTQSNNGNYTGFDMSDNLSTLDSAFNTIKVPTQSRTNFNSTPQMNDSVAPFTSSNIDKFSLF